MDKCVFSLPASSEQDNSENIFSVAFLLFFFPLKFSTRLAIIASKIFFLIRSFPLIIKATKERESVCVCEKMYTLQMLTQLDTY
jgi:hypothetical protein